MGNYNQEYKQVDYDYDLVSGKVNMISYNRGFADQFYQKYEYDADNRITDVYTSNDGEIWNPDARYSYYQHGPLARLQLGQNQVQSLEYAYTIQGWLKSVNGDVLNPVKDMGTNGLSGDMTYARDVMSHALRYFDQDYKPIGTKAVVSVPDATVKNLYNGNITQQTTGIGGLGTMQRVYEYDQLQRLKLATNTNINDYTSAMAPTPSNLYKSTYSYDMDGNITNLSRWDGSAGAAVQIDNFAYKYTSPTGTAADDNRLQQVQDGAGTTTGTDLQPGQPADNYVYDRTGNLLKDKQGNEEISWDRFGKVSSIRDVVSNRYIQFGYDGKGNRVYKNVITPIVTGDGKDEHQGEYYVRDAGGNILATYRFHSKYNRRASLHQLITSLGGAPYTPVVSGGTALTDLLTSLTDRAFPGLLISKILVNHGTWSDTYTDRPVSFYMGADPTLKSNLLYTGEAWIDELKSVDAGVYTTAFLGAGTAAMPFYESALNFPTEGQKLLEHYSMEMPAPVCQGIWAIAQAPYLPGNHVVNAGNLYTAISSPQAPARSAVINALVSQVVQNSIDSLPNASSFYGSLVAEPMLWNSSSLRDNNGPWTVSLRELVNNYADETALASFFDGWSGGSAALAGATMPDYKLTTVYNASPARAITDMVLEAGAADVEDVITDEEDVTAFELGKLAVTGGMLSVDEMTSAIVYGTAGDTISLGEHHIYGSSRVGVQRYDSLQLANLLNLSDAGAVRSTLMSRVPWYSYAYADVISSSKKQEYDGTINTYSGVLNNTSNLGRRYYELTDHLGNVLATVLDRKTGYKTSPGATLYDHWSADLASVTDYYPGGMMMPGRNLEHDWSRHGYNGQAKDDEVYGKGNLNTAKFWEMDTRILRRWNLDPVDQISVSNYAVNSLNPIWFSDPLGDKDDKDVKNNPNAPSRKGGTESFHKDRIASAKPMGGAKENVGGQYIDPKTGLSDKVSTSVEKVDASSFTGTLLWANALEDNAMTVLDMGMAGEHLGGAVESSELNLSVQAQGISSVSKVGAQNGNAVNNRQTTALVNKYPPLAELPGTKEGTFLMPGELIDRFGSLGGKWFSTPGTPYASRSIPPGLTPYTQFKVLKPFEVQKSVASPGLLNGQAGFGVQYQSSVGADILIKRGIITPIK